MTAFIILPVSLSPSRFGFRQPLTRGAAITDVQHLLGHSSVKTTERAYAAFVKTERFKQTIDLLDEQVVPRLKVVS